jgi:hypothetical protein
MRNDVKINRLIRKYGLEGYGLYNLIVESIAESLSSDHPIPELEETAEDIADKYRGDTAKISEMMQFMLKQGLFEVDEITGRILCRKIYKFIDKSQTRSEEIRSMIEIYKTSVCPRQIETVRDIADRSRVEVEEDIDSRPKKFRIPTESEVQSYLATRSITYFTASQFIDFYTARGWLIGKNKMKDWRAAVRTWESRAKSDPKRPKTTEELYG